MSIASLFTIAKIGKQSKCPSTDKWIKKMWCVYICVYVYVYEYYSAIKNNGFLPFAAMWINLGNIMLGEISQTEKDKYYIISHIYHT